jgi:hypothetical protein
LALLGEGLAELISFLFTDKLTLLLGEEEASFGLGALACKAEEAAATAAAFAAATSARNFSLSNIAFACSATNLLQSADRQIEDYHCHGSHTSGATESHNLVLVSYNVDFYEIKI